MTLHRLIYASRPFGFDTAMLGGIMVGARRNNRRDAVTGALICRADIYMQLLEGPVAAVEAAFARIERDDRHLDVTLLSTTAVDVRMFPTWDMLDDPARSWLWSPTEIADGAVNAAAPAAVAGVFARVAAERQAAATPAACPAAAIA